ncbi:hypothetical protein AVEN_56995-1 [Araneus ventricosus]|uniref:Uncharacterized protein n=1 Tax=Araneus ventricosus TaxID=182803 RepID=A0A4Y2RDK0_ARAVE|nr:hypothetical protein AVEN_56995-1 [Araneus ventricosus]
MDVPGFDSHQGYHEYVDEKLPVRPRWPSGKVLGNPIPPNIRRVRGLLHAKSYVVAKRPPVGVTWMFGDGGASSGVVLVI